MRAPVNIRVCACPVHRQRVVLVIRRLLDRRRAYTGIFLPGEPPRIFPTSDAEHARILQIYKQDRPHEGVHNDFSEYALGRDTLGELTAASRPSPNSSSLSSPPSPPAATA